MSLKISIITWIQTIIIEINELCAHTIFRQLWQLDRSYTMIQIQNSSVSCIRISAKMSTANADRNTSCSKCTVRRYNTCTYMSRILLNEQVCSYVKRIAGVRCVVCCVVVCRGTSWGVVFEHLFGAPFWAIWRDQRGTWADMWTGSGFFFWIVLLLRFSCKCFVCVSLYVGCAVLHCVRYAALCPAGGPARQTVCVIYFENKTHEAAHTQIRTKILDLLWQYLRVEILVCCQQ